MTKFVNFFHVPPVRTLMPYVVLENFVNRTLSFYFILFYLFPLYFNISYYLFYIFPQYPFYFILPHTYDDESCSIRHWTDVPPTIKGVPIPRAYTNTHTNIHIPIHMHIQMHVQSQKYASLGE